MLKKAFLYSGLMFLDSATTLVSILCAMHFMAFLSVLSVASNLSLSSFK